MESPTNSLKKIILSIKTKFSQRSLSNPRIIHPDLLDYFGNKPDFNLLETNHKIKEDISLQNPDIIFQKPLSLQRKKSEPVNRNYNETLNYIPSIEAPIKLIENNDKSKKTSPPTSKGNLNITSSKTFALRKKSGGLILPINTQNKKCQSPFSKPKKKTLFDVLSNFYLTKKFINTLKSLTSKRTPKFLSKFHFNIINDLTFFFDIWKKNENEQNEKIVVKKLSFQRQKTQIIEIIKKKYKHFFENFKVFDNSSTFIIFWNLIHLFFILFFFFTIPLEACFDVKLYQENQAVSYLQKSAVYFFLCDILINCNTAVYLKGKLIKNHQKIVKNYIKTNLLKDIISIISIFAQLVFMDNNSDLNDNFLLVNLFRILFFFRMRNFSSIIKQLEEMFFIDHSIHNILSLFNLIFRIILLSHIFACLWFYIGTLSTHDSWIIHEEIMSEPWWNKYIYSFYYVCITMNTVGYGDIVPQNSIEKVFTIIFIYIACGIFAYSINKIGVIVSEIAKRENEFQKDMNIINEFMKKKKIDFDLRMRVRKYLEYIWFEEKIENFEEQSKTLEKLSKSLKEELLIEANGNIIRDLKMFSFNFSEDLLKNTITLLKEVRYTPGDLIFMKGDYDNKDLYIIRKGKVEIFLENNKVNSPVTILKTLQRVDHFGEISFFSDQERTACARSVDFTTAYIIKKDDFLGLLKKYPMDYQKFCEIKDNINLYEDYKSLYIKCYSCNEVSHLVQECPNLNHKPIKDVLLHRFFNSIDQIRKPTLRKNYKRLKAIKVQSFIEKKSFELQSKLFNFHQPERSLNSNDSKQMDQITEENENSIEEKSLNSFPEEQRMHSERKTKKKITEIIKIKERTKEMTNILETEEISTLNKKFFSLNSWIKNEEVFDKNDKTRKESNKFTVLLNFIDELKEGDNEKNGALPKFKEENLEKELKIPFCEMVKTWHFYFTYNNCEKIIENYNKMNQKSTHSKKNNFSKSSFLPNIRKFSQSKIGYLDNFEKMQNSKMRMNGRNSLMKNGFFQSSNIIEKFMNERQFDLEKLKKKYGKGSNKNEFQLFLKKILKKILKIFSRKKKKSLLK